MEHRVSLITTVFNERKSISSFLVSIATQSQLPDELVIVDAGSSDGTVNFIGEFAHAHPEIRVRLFNKPGNRSIGRNTAIREATNDIIASTDAGCILDNDWLAEITAPFANQNIDFVGGWYEPIVKSVWQGALSAVLTIDVRRVNRSTFLPSARSMAFRKSLWGKIGGFNEKFSHNEDTPFSMIARRVSNNFIFQPNAIVHWDLMKSNRELFKIVHRYAFGDGECLLFRSQYIIACFWMSMWVFFGFMIQFSTVIFLPLFLLSLGYLFIPFMYLKKRWRPSYFFQIPIIKFTLIGANVIGFLRGLGHKIFVQKKGSRR